ncbi:type I-C CRISPR-associated endonuclease Cas1c [Desulfovibrio aminophilus]|nr:type I-C CRISPR-associated endonuclease Cas1c [Desulfovibrio aminophilus]MCM0756474.1 type I-C CRISPR-associated endonuclease Cas1c [Desulfovibrio aminophilus]
MKHYLNTLYVTTQGAYLAKDGECVLVRVEGEDRLRLPIHGLGGIVCFGQVSCSPFLLGHCAENGVGVSFLTERGRFLARVQGPVSGNVLLRREQYRRADDPAASAAAARCLLTGKIANCRAVLLRTARDHEDKVNAGALRGAAERLTDCGRRLDPGLPLDVLRGIEGEAGNAYFEVFDHLLTNQKEEFRFSGRSRRPPLDRINCLLSFFYVLLAHDVRSALESVGLDPAVGFLHRDRPGRPGLALDLMEEFRPVLADRLALSLVNLGQVQARGFRVEENGAVRMDDDTRKAVLVAYQKRKQEEMRHPFLDEKAPLGLMPYLQALLFARWLRGDLDGYPPFLWR